jgi:hypothetical protein
VLVQALGQATALSNDRLNITMFAPDNAAFQAPLPQVAPPQKDSYLSHVHGDNACNML